MSSFRVDVVILPDLADHFLRVVWVKGEIQKLEEEISTYIATEPLEVYWCYGFGRSGSTREYRVRCKSDIPKGAQIRTGTLVNEMRSILDSLACTLAVRNKANNIKDVYLPTGADKGKFLKACDKKIKKLSLADKALIESLEIYPGGNELLYTFHSTDIIRKHQKLVLFINSLKQMKMSGNSEWILSGYRFKYIVHLKQDELFTQSFAVLNLDYHIDFQMTAGVSFAEPDFITGKSVIATMSEFVNAVQSALEIFH